MRVGSHSALQTHAMAPKRHSNACSTTFSRAQGKAGRTVQGKGIGLLLEGTISTVFMASKQIWLRSGAHPRSSMQKTNVVALVSEQSKDSKDDKEKEEEDEEDN